MRASLAQARVGTILALGTMLCLPRTVPAATYEFTTAPGAIVHDNGGNPYAEDASVTFITALDQITIRITNMQQETSNGNVIQTIAAVDFHLQGLTGASLTPTLLSWLGEIGILNHTTGNSADFLNNSMTYSSAGGNTANLWGINTNFVGAGSNNAGAEISGGIQLTALTGNNTTQLILGPPNTAPNTYNANGTLIGSSPLLRTQTNTYIEYVIQFGAGSGVTAATIVDGARISFGRSFGGTSELDLMKTPEPGTFGVILGGLGLAAGRKILRRRKSR